MSKIIDDIYVCGIREVNDGFDSYINLSDFDIQNPLFTKFDIKDYREEAPAKSQFLFLSMITDILKYVKGKTLFFCNAGMQRSCAACAAYLIMNKGYSYDQAIICVKKGRKEAFPNHITYAPALRLLSEIVGFYNNL